jgi:DNA-binding CsgD family transcriptional regulator
MNDIPAGIEDNNVEFYRHGNTVNATYGGARFVFNALPAEIREPFAVELINDKKAFHCLIHDMKVNPAEAEEKLVWCRYGHHDYNPDYNYTTKKLTPDAPGCENESHCHGFGIVCRIPPGVNGHLTKQEFFVLRLIARGKQDKEIAAELGIEVSTVRTYIQRIHYKLRVNNRIEIFIWAQSYGIQ